MTLSSPVTTTAPICLFLPHPALRPFLRAHHTQSLRLSVLYRSNAQNRLTHKSMKAGFWWVKALQLPRSSGCVCVCCFGLWKHRMIVLRFDACRLSFSSVYSPCSLTMREYIELLFAFVCVCVCVRACACVCIWLDNPIWKTQRSLITPLNSCHVASFFPLCLTTSNVFCLLLYFIIAISDSHWVKYFDMSRLYGCSVTSNENVSWLWFSLTW